MTGPGNRTGLLAAALAAALAGPAAGSGLPVSLLPLGAAPAPVDIEHVARAVEAFYGVPVQVLEPARFPDEAWYAPRRRWRAEKVIGWLEAAPPAGGLVVGLTGEDISTTGRTADWGVIGLARLGGSASVVSGHRCRSGEAGGALARERLAKVVLHEVGHMLGLDHCPSAGCLLHDAGGLVATVDAGTHLCDACLARLERRAGVSLPGGALPAWLSGGGVSVHGPDPIALAVAGAAATGPDAGGGDD